MSDAARAEKAFDDLTDWLVTAISRVRADIGAQTGVLEEGVRRYADARKLVDPEEPYSYVVHFFSADGVGWESKRKPAFERLGASHDELGRWNGILSDTAARFEAEMFA